MEISPRHATSASGIAKQRRRLIAVLLASALVAAAGITAAQASTEYGAWYTVDVNGVGSARARNYVYSNTTNHSFRAYTLVERYPYTSHTIPAYAVGARALLYKGDTTLLASTTYSYNVAPVPGSTTTVVLSATPTKTYTDPMAAYSNGRIKGTNSSGTSYEAYIPRSAQVFNY
jgi:hypothetical protein